MKKFICLCMSILFVITCAGCDNSSKDNISLNDVIKTANENWKGSQQPPDIKKYLYKYNDNDAGFTDKEVDMLTNFDVHQALKIYNGNKALTQDMALSDVNYLFRLLKYTYGGYQYFGGDKVFDAAKKSMVSSLKGTKNITADELEKVMYKSLKPIIKDGHFSILGNSLIDDYMNTYFYNKDYEFHKDKNGYYTFISNKKYYLKSVGNSAKVQDYLKLTIDNDGNLAYNIGLLQKNYEAESKINIKLIRKNKELDKDIPLTKSESLQRDDTVGFSKIISEVPIVTCTRMYDENNDNTCKLFAETGKELKKYAVSIIDIRNNGGGNDTSSKEWFEWYTGMEPEPSYAFAQLLSKIYLTSTLKFAQNDIKNNKNMTKDEYNMDLNYCTQISELIKNKNFNKWETDTQTGSLIDNKNLIFVLIDKGVASSGETFVKYLRTLKNVVFVGTNTWGCSLISNNFTYKLPDSGIILYFGTGLYLSSNHMGEGTGFMPDIWTPSSNALDRVIKLINKNALNKKQ